MPPRLSGRPWNARCSWCCLFLEQGRHSRISEEQLFSQVMWLSTTGSASSPHSVRMHRRWWERREPAGSRNGCAGRGAPQVTSHADHAPAPAVGESLLPNRCHPCGWEVVPGAAAGCCEVGAGPRARTSRSRYRAGSSYMGRAQGPEPLGAGPGGQERAPEAWRNGRCCRRSRCDRCGAIVRSRDGTLSLPGVACGRQCLVVSVIQRAARNPEPAVRTAAAMTVAFRPRVSARTPATRAPAA